MSTTIPTPDELRADIRARAAELRALRKLLRLSEAAREVDAARQARVTTATVEQRQEVASA
jgi:hypothetical protein